MRGRLSEFSGFHAVVVATAVLGTAGCKNDDTGPTPDPDPLMCDVPQLFVDRCGGEGCHGTEGSTAANLDLVSPGVEDRVSNAPGSSCAGILANPGDPEASLLYTKLTDDPGCGARMPMSGEPLTDDEMTCVRDWISGLLPPTPTDTGTTEDCPECVCDPMTVEPCYEGPADTENNGICVGGTHTCANNGLSWSECEGQVLPRGEDCTTAAIDENCDGVMPPCSEEWARAFGDGLELSQNMRGIGVDAAGNVYATGDFEGTLSFGGEPLAADGDKYDVVVTKHDHFGNPVWSRRFGDTSNQYGGNLIVDQAGNVVIIGRMFGNMDFDGNVLDGVGTDDIYVAKLDSDGNHVWSRVLGGKDPDRAERLAFDSLGNVVITGAFTGEADVGGGTFVSAGMRDAFVLKLNGTSGAVMWAKQFGGAADDYGFGIDTDATDNVLITGRFQDSIDIGAALMSAGGRDIYVAKLDAAGTPVWANAYGGSGEDASHDLQVDPATGNVFVTGFMSETVDFGGGDLVSAGLRDIFMASFDQDGNHRWSDSFGDAADQFEGNYELNQWMSLAVDDAGDVVLGGSLQGMSADFGGVTLMPAGGMNADVFFVKFSGVDGSPLVAREYGSSSTDLAAGVAVDSAGHVFLAGRSYGSAIDFGAAGIVFMYGNTDGFIAKLLP
jgi:hypothetical protein